ncbi:UDP-N-acetylglucosamine diphosphorylase/glucosamine-1-phosphate N-acetyltransferase [Acinetobacter sp. ANC 4558]|uniref:bifunctional UDP-N-acetylglucosamine diphosphorylase/glucosamine-1-phosphate N-acetyltransferase GlmU n=1 Tax=Acinetobacter sp. ANC 4558 TaxID=1977876 RepID=UPI000A34CA5E|nr:bifunctional UDP-N-acetylglucosamine diphosphorylase/glucosamine-1-phosphate N-acetyltransferase GlmU [Acinetobacter sp. ANC 4558]OTG86710.1 UDP-N-acetylglucosamine diphosphorylase/glucosamine-1-phosphate N-acetyltransferase [Acinetobacter sp. ANC 4558]
MSTSVIILAAGKGTRMRSSLPKVLQPLAGRPLLSHVIETAKTLNVQNIITIFGHGGEFVQDTFRNENILWVEQKEQLGTGHAVQTTLSVLPTEGMSLILSGDVPCIGQKTLNQLLSVSRETGIGIVTLTLEDSTGYGRIIRHNGQIQAIIEHKDATDDQHQIKEINTGIYCVSNAKLHEWLPQLSNNNVQGEYYLTDIIAMAIADGLRVASVEPEFSFEVEGVNDRLQLAALERKFQAFQAKQLMQQGVHLIDPARFDLRGKLIAGQDVRIDINVIIEGHCEIGNNVEIGAGCIIKNTKIAAGTIVKPYSIFEDTLVGENTIIGPFARLRPGTQLANDVHIGNFVEVKNSNIGAGSKANHFTYLGDTEIGIDSNIGAGTITCNYDGVNKSKTLIGNHVFIGSNSSLVAPVSIGHGATVGAGSTITRDVIENSLAVERSKQFSKENYQRPQKIKK